MDEMAPPAGRHEGRNSLSERLRLAIDRLTDPEIEAAQAPAFERLAEPPMDESAQGEPTNPNTQEA